MQITDCHLHFIDHRALKYPHFLKVDPGFVAVVGDYTELPRIYLPEDYLNDTRAFQVTKTVMAEFVSADALKEATWAQELADRTGYPHAIITLADPLHPEFNLHLECYAKLKNVRALRQHLLWDPNNPLKRFAPKEHLMRQAEWRKNFARLKDYSFAWEFEIFAHQVPEMEEIARLFPDIRMVLHPMGWPLDQSKAGFAKWQRALKKLSKCQNVIIKITAIGAIFPKWNRAQVAPWIRAAIEIFGPERAMFGSHMPIEKLEGHTFTDLYHAYFEIVKDLTTEQQRWLFQATADACYRL